MKTYNINRQRDGRNSTIISNGLTLEEARKELLDLFNMEFGTSFNNWGVAVLATRNSSEGATPTHADGTRSFTYDVYRYWIEIEG